MLLPVDGYLDCFHTVILPNESIMNIHGQVFMWTYVFILGGEYLEVEWLDHMVRVFLTI